MNKSLSVKIASVAALGAALPNLADFYQGAVAAQAKRGQELIFFSELAGKKRDELLADFSAFPGSWKQFLELIACGDNVSVDGK